MIVENLEIKNTICNATKLRQEETEELAKRVDSMIIIGGKNSSNTKKLYEISAKECEKVVLVENVKVLEEKKLPISEYVLFASSKSAGTKIEFMGKEYVVKDGDVILFRFNV